MAEEGKSIRWIVIVSMIFVAYLGWGFMAGSYAEIGATALPEVGNLRIRRGRGMGIALLISAVVSFVVTSITELPNFFSVISFHMSNRIWLPILFIVLEGLVLAGGYGLQKLEENLEKPRHRRKKKKR